MAIFAAAALTVWYGDTLALDCLDLSIGSGEIFVLLGGSGSGKTTLLRCIGGFVTPQSGRLLLDGRDITGQPPHRRPVNTMFQSYALFPHLTVGANIAFGLRALDRRGRRTRIGELLDLVRLQGFERRSIATLSGGQQQRVALARTLAPRPRLVLLDEPFSALDRALREATGGEFLTLLRSIGTTAILVTHDQDEALASADRIGVLDRGRLAQVGTPSDVYERPANRFVASFLGAANILEGVVRRQYADGVEIAMEGGIATATGAAPVGTHVALALRPERIRLDGGSDGVNCLAGVVQRRAYRGSALDITVLVAGRTPISILHPLGDGLRSVPSLGTAVRLCWAEDAAVLLAS